MNLPGVYERQTISAGSLKVKETYKNKLKSSNKS